MKKSMLVGMVIILAGCSQYKDWEHQKSEQKMQQFATEYLVAELKSNLKDPESAQLRGVVTYSRVRITSSGERYASEYAVCGEINAKNSYGAYGGYTPFFASGVRDYIHSTMHHDGLDVRIADPRGEAIYALFQKQWAIYCVNTESQLK